MKYNFDKSIERNNTDSLKVDFKKEHGMSEDVLPLWVADMDYETAPCIIKALNERVAHGIYGYSYPKERYMKSVIGWMNRRHQWDTKASWYVFTPGVVYAIATAIRAFTKTKDRILVQEPVYYPFMKSIESNDRVVVNCPLIYEPKQSPAYRMDFERMEQLIVTEDIKVCIFCSPHNPVGRVWSREELEQFRNLVLKYHLIVISDEIHMDFTYNNYKHTVLASMDEQIVQQVVTCTSPSKTFNLAGLQISNIIIANENLRQQFKEEVERTGYDEPNLFGIVACQAAYEEGDDWLDELMHYLEANLRYVHNFIKEHLPSIRLIEPEGTYLLWLDFSAYHLSEDTLNELIQTKAKLWLDSGEMFGEGGATFQRINIATSRSVLEQAFNQLEQVFLDYEK